VPVAQYTPNVVKQAVAGYGAAGKAQVQAMVARLLHLAEPPSPPDAADALALAICHLSAGRFRAAAGRAVSDRQVSDRQVSDGGGSGFTPPAPLPALARAIAAATDKERR
jgi:crossover junction endodeoxyribonuclease RuvC